MVDSFQIFASDTGADAFTVIEHNTDPSVREHKNEIIKSTEELFIKYFVRCSGQNHTIYSDTLSFSSIREAVELDTIQVLPDGQVSLSWQKIPTEGMTYIVKSIIDESSHEISGSLQTNSYTDSRKLANHEKVFYSISAYNSCRYNLPEPDEFYHTSFLTGQWTQCSGKINFEFEPFSSWRATTASRHLMVLKEGKLADSVELGAEFETFSYDRLQNNTEYEFYVREISHSKRSQVAISNHIKIHTDFYDPIRWITIHHIDIDENDNATVTWETNPHLPKHPFHIHAGGEVIPVENTSLSILEPQKKYQITIPSFAPDEKEYALSLQDSCGNEIISLPKKPLVTQGNLSGGLDLNIQWSDIGDQEWLINRYHIFYKNNGSFSQLSSVSGSNFQYHHLFEESNPVDSLCYYIEAEGDLYFPDKDSTTTTKIRSNTICLYGETTISIPNAFHADGDKVFKPIIAPRSNIRHYTLTIFDRYGNIIFKTHDIEEGWRGTVDKRKGFTDTYVVFVELEINNGEKWKESGSLLLFH